MSRAPERKPARLVETSGVRVQRYFPGKAPAADIDLSSSEDESEQEAEKPKLSGAAVRQPISQTISIGTPRVEQHAGSGQCSELESESGSEESDAEAKRLMQARLRARQRASEEGSDLESSASGGSDNELQEARRRAAMRRQILKESANIQPARSDSSESNESEGSESSEAESSSENEDSDEYTAVKLLKPVFIPKSQRQAKHQPTDTTSNVADEEIDRSKDAETRGQSKEERRAVSVRLAAEEARRAMEAPEVDSKENADVDDADDIDPKAEYQSWKLRELLRIKRGKEEREAADLEEEERARRRNMTEEEKYKEDMERVRRQNEERRHRGLQGVAGQKHFHKGAFFQDSGEEIYQRDFSDPRPDESATAIQELPEYMGLKALNRRAKSKWAGYKKEDTSDTGSLWTENRRMARRMAERSGGLHDGR
ncbi:hypothetical protein GGI12_003764 [Dipsacomyces acuminosporus]|nr:hypothetical protein GGI12_003764 [Dipsacomyces acuminosporus]